MDRDLGLLLIDFVLGASIDPATHDRLERLKVLVASGRNPEPRDVANLRRDLDAARLRLRLAVAERTAEAEERAAELRRASFPGGIVDGEPDLERLNDDGAPLDNE